MRKEHAHQLLDELDPGQFNAVSRLLEVMADPVARALAAAPADDEPVTEEERRRFHEGQTWFASRDGEGIPMEEVIAGLGREAGRPAVVPRYRIEWLDEAVSDVHCSTTSQFVEMACW
jgi:hypothetical protein